MSCEIARYLIYASVSCMNGAFVALRLNSESVMNSPFYESPFSPQILKKQHNIFKFEIINKWLLKKPRMLLFF